MRFLAFILILFAGLAPAATVDFSTLLPNGQPSTLPITVTPLIKLTRSGTNLVAGIPLTLRPTNGPNPLVLLGGRYLVSIAGSSETTILPVPDDSGSYSAAALATNLVTFLWTNQFPLVSGIIAGTGMTGSTNAGVVTLTATAQVPANVVTNGQVNVSFGNVTATAIDGAVTTPNLLVDTIQSRASGFVDVPATLRTTEDGSFAGLHTGTFEGIAGLNLAGSSNVNLTTATGVLPLSVLPASLLLVPTSGTNVAVNVSASLAFHIILTNNVWFSAPTNLRAGAQFSINLVQDSEGQRTVRFDPNYWRFPSGQVLTTTTNAGSWSIISGMVGQYGTNVAVVQTLNFQ